MTKLATPISDHAHNKILRSTFKLCEFVSTCQKFSQIWNLCRNTANNINFHYRLNSVKINTKIFQYIQKKTLFLVHFCPNFPIFGTKTFFLENPALSRTTSYECIASCQNLEKTNYTIPRKCRWKDRWTLFHRTLPANNEVPIKP